MKLNQFVISLVTLFMGLSAHSASKDRMFLENEAFRMIDLNQGQCSVEVTDNETEIQPQITLSPMTIRAGTDFLGGIYLSSWTHQVPSTFTTIQVFKGDNGRKIIDAYIELTYQGLEGVNYSKKQNLFFLLLDSSNNLVDFKERLSYQINNEKTYAAVNIPGKTYYDSYLHSVPQSIESTGGKVSFKRTTVTGLTISVSCNI